MIDLVERLSTEILKDTQWGVPMKEKTVTMPMHLALTVAEFIAAIANSTEIVFSDDAVVPADTEVRDDTV